jgi:glucosylceramidase
MKEFAIYLTSRDGGQRIQKIDPAFLVKPSADPDGLRSVNIDERVTYQTIEGFGGAFTDSGAATLAKLSPIRQEELLRAYFDNDSGHGYSLCRTHINSCDFSLGNYAYCEKDGDFDLASFTIERDRKYLLPMIQRAMKISRDGFKLFASPWSPPAWMKTNGEMNNGGKLKPECRQVWADYYVRYIREYQKEGVPIWGLTIQNEPAATQRWDSCVYTGEEERDFVRDFLGPTLEKNGLGDQKVVIWDHNRDKLFERARVVYDDPEAAKYVWGAGFHWYCADVFESVQRTHDAWPDKKLLFTEGCQEGGPHRGAWAPAERYGTSIIEDLNHWTVGWVDWNMILDETGGPNHVGNFCHAPVMVDTQKGEILYQASYYYLGHFSRFIKPGAKRILCSSCHDDLLTTACVNPDGRLVVVAMNRSETPMNFLLRTGRGNKEVFSPRRSIQTILM